MESHIEKISRTCPTCGKSFLHKGNLNGHLRLHTGERPYVCSICHKSFNQRGTLTNHMKIHSNEAPHKCPTCGKSFKRKDYLTEHLKIHTDERPYLCSSCGKSFRHGSHLAKHMKSHSDETPHTCTFCGKSFKYKSSLNTHLKVHTDEGNCLILTLGDNHSAESSDVSKKDGEVILRNNSQSKRIGSYKSQELSTSHFTEGKDPVETSSTSKSLSKSADDVEESEAKLHTSEVPFIIDVKVEEDI